MKNPWEKVLLSDYEEHMKLPGIHQLQSLHSIMEMQINTYPVQTLSILGVAGGNGLDLINKDNIKKVYGIDINEDYLKICRERYAYLGSCLKLQRIDLTDLKAELPAADMVIANLFIEYIGTEFFAEQLKKNVPEYVSCVIQKNQEEEFVSDSPYTRSFTEIAGLHSDIDKEELTRKLNTIDMVLIREEEILLPNKKVFIRLDYRKL